MNPKRIRHQDFIRSRDGDDFLDIQQQLDNSDGSEPPEPAENHRPTYAQNWPAYDAAKTNEDVFFKRLLLELLLLAIEEPAPNKCGGRPGFSRKDKLFAMCIKTYYKSDLRKATSILKELHNLHLIGNVPCYKSIDNFFNDSSLNAILDRLILLTALPLASVEDTAAMDSTGFSISKYESWNEHKWGTKTEKKRCWRKLHAVTGTKTNIFITVEVTEKNIADITMLPTLVPNAPKYFPMREFVADKAYNSRAVFNFLEQIGLTPFIPYKSNTVVRSKGSRIWKEMYEFFLKHTDDYLDVYHRRSNIETNFHMLKSRYGTHLYTKHFIANSNELKTRVLCHNLCVLIQEAAESGLNANFEACVKTLQPCVETP